jgi:hypothetical protein
MEKQNIKKLMKKACDGTVAAMEHFVGEPINDLSKSRIEAEAFKHLMEINSLLMNLNMKELLRIEITWETTSCNIELVPINPKEFERELIERGM